MSVIAPKPKLNTGKIDSSFFLDDKKQGAFIAENLFNLSKPTLVYLGFLAIIIIVFSIQFSSTYHLLDSRSWIIAVIGSLLAVLVPIHIIHEILRASIMKSFGKALLNYVWSWRQLILRVEYKDISKAETHHIPLANITPFILFTILPILLSFISNASFSLFFITTAFFHLIYSVRGFALLNFIYNKRKLPFTENE